MKRNYKEYFCGSRWGSIRTRLVVALIIWVYGGIILGSRLHRHPSPLERFIEIIETVVFHAIPLFLLPVMIWGTRWEKIAAWLLSFLPLANLFVYLTMLLGIG
ncbi:MAG: hypothetical protein M2R45_04718 [Verrucomicrobia subdivision 3 bacterium]|nr:hypothetical protein [Limisphaerales bacterium]MCS1416259.1 hypothetical protein [Limisphaerales bacterium]